MCLFIKQFKSPTHKTGKNNYAHICRKKMHAKNIFEQNELKTIR